MADGFSDADGSHPPPWGGIVNRSRLEVIPLKDIEEKTASLPPGSRVTVTCSPKKGIDATMDLTETLVNRGMEVIPHLAARTIDNRQTLEKILARIQALGIREIFVPGGDRSEPLGDYTEAYDLLRDIDALGHRFEATGITGYPEGHPMISDEKLWESLHKKKDYATHIATQLCFDPEKIISWVQSVRDAGIALPVYVGLPGVVDRAKLVKISLSLGIGQSLSYLRKNTAVVTQFFKKSGYDPDELVSGLEPHLNDPALGIAGLHLFTFNQVESTADWLQRKKGQGESHAAGT